MPNIDQKTRKQIAVFLPCAIETAIHSYQDFSNRQLVEEGSKNEGEHKIASKAATAKDFKDHHDACKVAIAHIKLLIELAKVLGLPDKSISHGDMAGIIAAANKELGRD